MPPPFLLTAGLVFWGGWSGFLWFALPAALILELAPRARWRWDVSDKEFDRLTNFSNFMLLVAGLYLINEDGAHGVFRLINWLPFLIFPLIGVQRYSEQGSIDISSLFLSMRRLRKKGLHTPRRIDLTHSYFGICILAAAVGVQQTPWFYPSLLLLGAWGIYGMRSRRYALLTWAVFLLAAAGLGYLGQQGLRAAHQGMESVMMDWFRDRVHRYQDYTRQSTAIGEIGRFKLSDRIEWRIALAPEQNPPELIRRATFQSYRFGTWSTPNKTLESPERTGEDEDIWILSKSDAPSTEFRLSGELFRGRGVIPLPHATKSIHRLPAEQAQRNRLNTFLVKGAPEFLSLDIHYLPGRDLDPTPQEVDLALSEIEQDLMHPLVEQLELSKLAPSVAAERLGRYFAENFGYTLTLARSEISAAPLREFLYDTRAGHCEYFATAGALLLRAAGIPTRYVSGFAVQEYDALSESYVVRRRHSHAWVLAWIQGRWRALDYTPSNWIDLETPEDSILQSLSDRWTLLAFALQEFWMRQDNADDEDNAKYAWYLIPLFALLGWRLYRRPRRKLNAAPASASHSAGSGQDAPSSPFDEVREILEKRGLPPRTGETPRQWVRRLSLTEGQEIHPQRLSRIVELHYQVRFDPSDPHPDQARDLKRLVQEWKAAAGA